MRFIDIEETDSKDKFPRVSSLLIKADSLQVIGNLPHGYSFRPKNARVRDLLVQWLNSLKFE